MGKNEFSAGRPVSGEAKKLLRERVGYRCTEFRGSGVTGATDVIRFEVDELGNEHILDELREVLGLPGSATLEQSLSAIRDRFGEDSKAIWLGTEEAVRELYCEREEEPIAVEIPEDAVLISDLGYDGQLFLFPGRGKGTTEGAETGEIEAETEEEIRRIFEEKRRRLGVEARLDLKITTDWGPPIIGKNVYGQAFPFERPPRVWIEVFAIDATTKEITETVCEELLHIKHPELSEEEIARMVPACVGNSLEEERRRDLLRRAGYP